MHGQPATTNVAFGGDDWKTLYFTTRSTLFSVGVKIAGVPVPVKKEILTSEALSRRPHSLRYFLGELAESFEIPTISTRCENLGKTFGPVAFGYTVVRRLPALKVLDLRLWPLETAA